MANELTFRITGDPSSFKAAMGQVSSIAVSTSNKVEAAGGKIAALTNKFSGMGTALSLGLTAPLVALGAGLVRTAADMDSLRRGLDSVATATDTTEAQLKRLKEVAKLPGLGFREAIQGSVALQSAGFSAQLAERSLKAFGNALATVGKGKADLDGVSLALGQIASKGKISAEEINQLAERVPQIRKAMQAAFGTADTEVLQKAGISATEFVTRVVAELEKLKQVSGGVKNGLENLSDALANAGDRIGSKLLPTVEKVLPKLEALAVAAADAVDGFLGLPKEVQNTAIALTAVALAAGPAIKAVEGVTVALGSVKAMAGLAGLAMGALFGAVVLAGIVKTMGAIDDLKAKTKDYYDFLDRMKSGGKEDLIKGQENASLGGVRVRESFVVPDIAPAAERFKIDLKGISAELNLFGVAAKKAEVAVANKGTAVEVATEKVKNHIKHHLEANVVTLDMAIANKIASNRMEEYNKILDRAADIGIRYGGVTAEQIGLNIQVADSLARYFRVLEQAPDFGGIAAGVKVPTFKQGNFGYEPFKGGSPNIGDEGMMTSQQAAEIKARYKDASGTAKKALQQVSLVVNDLARGITDVIFKGGKIGDMFANIAKQAAQSITRVLIEGALTKLSAKLFEVGGIMGKVFGGAGGAGGTIFSAGASAGSSAAGSAIAGGASAAGGISGAISSSMTSIVGAVAQVGTMISSIVGNFQFMAMNKSLDIIVKHTLQTANDLANLRADEWLREGHLMAKLDDIWGSIRTGGVGTAGGGTINVSMAGAYLMSDAQMGDFADRLARFLKARGA